ATDLTSAAFIAAFIRFISRRGKPHQMYSDNGGNFVAANKELAEMYALVRSKDHNDKMYNKLAEDEINWNFNPPAAPHMGGLWEATVKSCKYHLKRVLGPTPLTYEEFATFLAQVEACLNSRPLWKSSEDPNDVAALSPGHFLIGAPLTAIAEPDLTELKCNALDRWQHVQQMTQHFWSRWSSEYLHHLQKRTKWDRIHNNVKEGDVVVIIEDNTPPQKWKLGKILELHHNPSDPQNLIRTVTVKTAEGVYKRPIHRLCLLPTEESNELQIDENQCTI
ncbi:unnamed protein product, partial [Allacma fusca]